MTGLPSMRSWCSRTVHFKQARQHTAVRAAPGAAARVGWRSLVTLLGAWAVGCAQPQPAADPSASKPADALAAAVSPELAAAQPWLRELTAHDPQATMQARAQLLASLQRLAREPAFALGHQDTTSYGVGWTQSGAERSDVNSVCGSHVAVYGWELFRIEKDRTENGDGVNFASLRQHIRAAYERGGLSTVSWHVDNPMTGGDAWDKTPAVAAVLPGGPKHEVFLSYLDRVAAFLGSLRGPKGERIPVLFRPFHEHTGDWFWWGSTETDEAGYVSLFRMTVDYLRRDKGLDNLLIAYSPDGGRVFKKEDVLYRYPGDEYVDVIGLDYYFDPGKERLEELVTWLVDQAEVRGKIPALTEFGPRGGVNGPGIGPDWLSQKFLRPLLATPGGLKIAYALAWRNARPDHAYYPYPGHVGETDLKAVCDHPATLLNADVAAWTSPAP